MCADAERRQASRGVAQAQGMESGAVCKRAGCTYRRHATQRHGYCCRQCRFFGGHGVTCERAPVGVGPAVRRAWDRFVAVTGCELRDFTADYALGAELWPGEPSNAEVIRRA